LFYKVEKPPSLIVDFLSTQIYSDEASRISYNQGNIREIRSVFYEEEKGKKQRLDYLVLSFAPDVEVSIKESKEGIVLTARKSVALAGNTMQADERNKARVIAGAIALEKKFSDAKLTKGKTNYIAPKFEYEGKYSYLINGITSFDRYAKLKPLETSEDKQLAVASIRKTQTEEGVLKQIKPAVTLTSTENEASGFNWAILSIISAFLISVVVISMAILSAKDEEEKLEDEKELIDDFFDQYQYNYPQNPDRKGDSSEDILDKCIEKRKFARFQLPQSREDSLIVNLETEKNRLRIKARDLSLGGLCIEVDLEIKVPSILQASLNIPNFDDENHVLARVAWSQRTGNNKRRYGISFLMVTEIEEKRIRKYLMETTSS
jgi:hypothetical protein